MLLPGQIWMVVFCELLTALLNRILFRVSLLFAVHILAAAGWAVGKKGPMGRSTTVRLATKCIKPCVYGLHQILHLSMLAIVPNTALKYLLQIDLSFKFQGRNTSRILTLDRAVILGLLAAARIGSRSPWPPQYSCTPWVPACPQKWKSCGRGRFRCHRKGCCTAHTPVWGAQCFPRSACEGPSCSCLWKSAHCLGPPSPCTCQTSDCLGWQGRWMHSGQIWELDPGLRW